MLQGDLRAARLCCGLALLYVCVWRHISLIQVKARAHCSEAHLIVSVPCLQSAVHWATSFLSANLRYRACILYLVMSSTRGVARSDCAIFCRTPHLGSLHGFVSSPSPSLCLRTLKTNTSLTCSLCASARSPCKHSRITACSNKFRFFMFDYHFICAKLQFSHAL